MKKYTLGLYEKAMPSVLGWDEKLISAREAGFDFVEISIDETDEKLDRLNMSKADRLWLVSLMYHTGMPIRTMCLSGHRRYPLGSADPEIRRRSMEIMEKAICLADDLGIRVIQLAGYDVYYEKESRETRENFLENLRRAVDMASSYGIQMGFETMETPFMDTVGKAMTYVEQMRSAYLNVYPDCGNMTNAALLYGGDVCRDLREGAGHLASLHLKETVPGKYREVPFGTGHVEFEKVIRCAWDLGIRRYVTEFWYTGSETWRADLRDANDRMRKMLDTMQEMTMTEAEGENGAGRIKEESV